MNLVPVETLGRGDTLVLPLGRRVEVEKVDQYDGDPRYFVRWASGGRHHRRHALAGERVELGSLQALPPGALVPVEGRALRHRCEKP